MEGLRMIGGLASPSRALSIDEYRIDRTKGKTFRVRLCPQIETSLDEDSGDTLATVLAILIKTLVVRLVVLI